MQVDTATFAGSDRVVAAYRLDDSQLPAPSEGAAEAVAALWSAVRSRPGARTMVLRGADRVWIATGLLLVEGKAGTNVGLLMPRMREEPPAPLLPPVPPTRQQDPVRRVLWNLALRLARIEASRVFVIQTSALHRIYATRDGFALPQGVALEDLLESITSAVAGGQPVRASLARVDEVAYGPVQPVVRLLGGQDGLRRMELAMDGWPVTVPDSAKMDDVSFARVIVERIASTGAGEDPKLTVLAEGGGPIAVVERVNGAWTVSGM